jgi:hypothetical protein
MEIRVRVPNQARYRATNTDPACHSGTTATGYARIAGFLKCQVRQTGASGSQPQTTTFLVYQIAEPADPRAVLVRPQSRDGNGQ